jgi:hypothetical protein
MEEVVIILTIGKPYAIPMEAIMNAACLNTWYLENLPCVYIHVHVFDSLSGLFGSQRGST